MKLVTSLLAAAAMSIASFVAPAFAQDKGVVGISMPTKTSTRWISDGETMERLFKDSGYTPDLQFAELRGNMQTRLAKAPDFDAIVVAAVAFQRLGLGADLTEVLGVDQLVPQVAQGALAVECRDEDDATAALLANIEHGPSRRRVDAEVTADVNSDLVDIDAHAGVAADAGVDLGSGDVSASAFIGVGLTIG